MRGVGQEKDKFKCFYSILIKLNKFTNIKCMIHRSLYTESLLYALCGWEPWMGYEVCPSCLLRPTLRVQSEAQDAKKEMLEVILIKSKCHWWQETGQFALAACMHWWPHVCIGGWCSLVARTWQVCIGCMCACLGANQDANKCSHDLCEQTIRPSM